MTADPASHQYDPDKAGIVVGIVADQPAEVLQTAATFAERFAAQLVLAEVTKRLDGRNVQWSTRALAGAPARQLHHLAEALDAAMIVIGVRKAGIRGSLHEFFNGSVAIQLAHSQPRPLVVVPLRGTGATRTERA